MCVCVPVHDDTVGYVNTLHVLVVVLWVGEQLEAVAGPLVFDLGSAVHSTVSGHADKQTLYNKSINYSLNRSSTVGL